MGSRDRESAIKASQQILSQRARRGLKPVTYGELQKLVGYGAPIHYGSILDELNRIESVNGRPPLSALVVNTDSRIPGDMFFEALDQIYPNQYVTSRQLPCWHRALADVYEYWQYEAS